MQAIIVVPAQVDGFDRFALRVDDVKLRVVVAYPFDADIWILVNAAWSFQEAFDLRQRVQASGLAVRGSNMWSLSMGSFRVLGVLCGSLSAE